MYIIQTHTYIYTHVRIYTVFDDNIPEYILNDDTAWWLYIYICIRIMVGNYDVETWWFNHNTYDVVSSFECTYLHHDNDYDQYWQWFLPICNLTCV